MIAPHLGLRVYDRTNDAANELIGQGLLLAGNIEAATKVGDRQVIVDNVGWLRESLTRVLVHAARALAELDSLEAEARRG